MKGLTLALLVACGASGPDPHELVSCSGWTVNGGVPLEVGCELACETVPPSDGPLCDPGPTARYSPCHSFSFGDVVGCCEVTTLETPVRFFECRP